MERDCCLTLGYAFDERFVYEFKLKNVIKASPSTILSCRIIDFQIGVFNSTILPPSNKVGYDFQNNTCFACLKQRKGDKKNYFHSTKRSSLLQEFYFVYDRRKLVKQSFITKINKFLPLYCSVSYFTEKEKDESRIISASTQKNIYDKKKTGKSELDLQISKVSGKRIEAIDKKYTVCSLHG